VRVRSVTPGPLFADDGSLGARLVRRARGIGGEVLALVVVTALLPLLLLGAFAVDLVLWLRRRKPFVAVRLVAFAWFFLLNELHGLLSLAWIWLSAGGPLGRGGMRRRRGVYNLRIRWAAAHLGAIRRLFGLRFSIEGLELAAPGPALVLIRHASIIDNMLPDTVIGREHGIGLRFVIKRELNLIPTIDIGGRWVPTYFVRRGSADAAGEIARLRTLAQDLGPGEAILIYPEGTRHTPAKLARAQEIIAERTPHHAPLAGRLRNLLPPRLGGPVALLEECLDAGVDIVVCGHVGLDGFEYISDIWRGGLVGSEVAVKFWRYSAADVPHDHEERIAFLYGIWHELDDWVGEQLAARGAAPGGGPPVSAAR
jgi:1-acyl-sn-glycerol-3-phosphate acyltransferase